MRLRLLFLLFHVGLCDSCLNKDASLPNRHIQLLCQDFRFAVTPHTIMIFKNNQFIAHLQGRDEKAIKKGHI